MQNAWTVLSLDITSEKHQKHLRTRRNGSYFFKVIAGKLEVTSSYSSKGCLRGALVSESKFLKWPLILAFEFIQGVASALSLLTA